MSMPKYRLVFSDLATQTYLRLSSSSIGWTGEQGHRLLQRLCAASCQVREESKRISQMTRLVTAVRAAVIPLSARWAAAMAL